jgi:CHAT domain
MNEAAARRRVESFRRRHGDPHFDLACHAALPLALSPDLLYRVWANFQRDSTGAPLGIPWVAVADLLLSPLCQEVGDELYEMDEAVRSVLLDHLGTDDRFGPSRLRQIAAFLDLYIEQQLSSDDVDVRDFAQAQHWVALAYTAPSAAASELAHAFAVVPLSDRSEVVRIASVVEALAAPLGSFPTLLTYARAAESVALGRDHPAIQMLQSLAGPGDEVEVAGVSIAVPSPPSPVRGEGTQGPPGGVRVRAADPQRLGVHRAIRVAGAPDGALPEYVPRDIDAEVRARVAAAARQGGFVILVGGSAVGKTRCALEAVKAVLPDWWLVQPVGPDEVVALAQAPPLRTVVWLDELQRYLDGEQGLTAAVVQALLAAPGPVVIIGTLWPAFYAAYATASGADGDDLHARPREVLRLAAVVRVGQAFSPVEQDRARAVAAHDPQVRAALEAGYGLTQSMTAAPQLIARWHDARAIHPYAWAVLTAALDVARLGGQAPLSANLLRAAAPGYLTARQRAEAPEHWFDAAMAYATSRLAGAAALLTPIPGDVGEPTTYAVADYLTQQAASERRDAPVPASTWDAIVSCVKDPADAARLADSARSRQLLDYAVSLYRYAASAGNRAAARQLAVLESGCHAIVWAEPDRLRTLIQDWLEEEGLNPRLIWGNSEMASFALSETSQELIIARFRARYPEALFKVIPPGLPDYLLDHITVTGQGGQSLTMRDVPLQLTLRELAESAARLHPAADSTVTREARTAHVRGAGFDRRVALNAGLWESNVQSGYDIDIDSIKFGVIRVIFMGASARQSREDARLAGQLWQIRNTKFPRHMRLVGEFPHARFEDIPHIMDLKPDIIHLACHGNEDILIFEDENGDPRYVSAELFADRLAASRRRNSSVRISGIVLNGCAGDAIAPLLLRAARTVVALHQEVSDVIADSFTARFYEQLSRVSDIALAASRAAREVGPEASVIILPPFGGD